MRFGAPTLPEIDLLDLETFDVPRELTVEGACCQIGARLDCHPLSNDDLGDDR